MMYGTVVRFFNSVIKLQALENMKEDIIELITKLVFNQPMSILITGICRMCTKDEERSYALKLEELSIITPYLIGLNSYFTLD
jgi:septum formation topological specificity factor MinE